MSDHKPLVIKTGVVTVPVEIDGKNGKELTFNPHDVLFMERLHRFYRNTIEKSDQWEKELSGREAEIKSIPVDDQGVPEITGPITDPVKDMNTFMRSEIDKVFGEGTARNIFGDAVYDNPEIYIVLVEGLKEYMSPVREKKIARYVAPKPAKRPRKRAKK